MYLDEQIALRMAQEGWRRRHARLTVRVRLGRTLVWLGRWMAGQPSSAVRSENQWLKRTTRTNNGGLRNGFDEGRCRQPFEVFW